MFRRGLLMAFLCLSCQAVVAQKHVHGDGQLLIAQDQQQWQFQFILPAADLLGFEYVPESAEQKEKLKSIVSKIENVEEMIRLPRYCTLVSMSHSLFNLNPQSLESTHSHANKHAITAHVEQGHLREHLDIKITYIFKCKNTPDSAVASVMEWASSLHVLNAQWITNEQQGAVKLKSSSAIIRFGQ
jgi:hypothetical protein